MLALRSLGFLLALFASGVVSNAPRIAHHQERAAERVVASGRVLDVAGRPVAGASVRFEVRRRGWSVAHAVSGRSGDDGRFELRGALPPGLDGVLHATSGERRALPPRPARAGDGGIEIVVARPAAVVGRVVVPKPAPDNLVVALAPRAGGDARVERVDALGRFEVGDLMPGAYDVAVRADPTDTLIAIAGLELAEGARVAPPELAAFDPGLLTLFDVRVGAHDRRALKTTIEWRPVSSGSFQRAWSTLVAPAGVLRIGARCDAIDVRAWAPGYRPAELHGATCAAPARIELARGLDVRLVLETALDLPPHVQHELALVPLERGLARFESTVGRADEGAYVVRAAVIGPHAAVLRVRERDRADPADPTSPYDLDTDSDRPWIAIEIGRIDVAPVEGEQAYALAPPAEALARARRGG